MNTKHLILLTIILILLVGCSSTSVEDTPSNTPTPDEATTPLPTPTAAQLGITILADGFIQPVQSALPLTFETGGKLLTVDVQVGDLVEVGAVIATLDDTDLQNTIVSASLQVEQAKNSLAQVQVELDNLLNWEPDELAVAQAYTNLNQVLAGPKSHEIASAQDAVNSALANLNRVLAGPNENEITVAAANLHLVQIELQQAQWAYDQVAYLGEVGAMPQAAQLQQVTTNYESALANYKLATQGPLHADITAAQSQLSQAQSNLTRLLDSPTEAEIATAEYSLDQALRGPKDGEIEAARLRVEQANISLAQSELSLTQAQTALADAQLLAPWTGTVLSVDATAGALVGSGSPIVTLLDMTQVEFHTTNLSERDLAQIFPGQTAIVTLKTYPNDPIEASVARIGLQAGATVGDAATFPVMLTLSETDLDIRPGMTGRAEILSEE